MPTEQKTIRKLRAILSADVKGYSLLMADNEAQTIQTLKAYRQIMFDFIMQHSGRVIDSPGDNLLAEFGSAVDAIESAVDIQNRLKKENEGIADDQKLQFRIGINIGDVVQDEDRIYGSGVNIAARIEGLADPGGICISRNAYDQIKDKLKLGYEYLGQHEVKNIKDPVRVYRVLSDPEDAGKLIGELPQHAKKKWLLPVVIVAAIIATSIVGHFYQSTMESDIEPAAVEKMAFPLPESPSIAVLPFVNMSEDPKQEHLSDGITEQIITTLSKVNQLFVISRTSTFAYKDKPVKVQQVSEELGVRYVLEGSVQRSGDRVRVTAQLIDAIDGKHLWAERYDRDLKDIFKLQDELTLKIVRSLRVKLVQGEQAKLWVKNTPDNLQYFEKLLEANFYVRQFNKESNIRGKQLYKEAIALEPDYSGAYSGLAWTTFMDVQLRVSKSPRESLAKAIKLCKKAITLDETQDLPHALLGFIYAMGGKFDKAIAECEIAIALNPNSAAAYNYLGRTLAYAGRAEEAIDLLKKAERLNPLTGNATLALGHAYREAGNYEEAITEYNNCIKMNQKNIFVYSSLAMTYALAGRYEEAREAWSEVLKLDLKLSVEKIFKRWPYGPDSRERIIKALHKAGIK